MTDRTAAPPFKDIALPLIPPSNRMRLDNGLPLHWVSIGTQEVIRIECIFRAESWLLPHPAVSFFTAKLLWEGTLHRTSAQLSQTLDLYGAFTDTVHTPDYFGLVVYTMPRFLPHILPVLAEVLDEASLPDKEWETLRNITLQQLKINQTQNSWIARSKFRSALFGDDSRYGYSQTEHDLRNLSVETLKSFYAQNIRQSAFSVFVSGKVEMPTLTLIGQYLGKRKISGPPVTVPVSASYDSKPVTGRIDIAREDSSQYTIRIGKRAPLRTDDAFFKILVTNEILGGYFGSRLMKNIREEKGLTYGISSYVPAMKHASYFMIATDVNKNARDQILDEIRNEITTLQTDGVPEAELSRVKKVMSGEFARAVGTAFEIGDLYQAIAVCDLPADFYDTYLEKVRAVTAEDVQLVAKNFLDPASMLEVVVG